MTAKTTTARRRIITPAEQSLNDAKHRARIVNILAWQLHNRTGRTLDETSRAALKDHGARCAIVAPWSKVPEDYKGTGASGARRVLVLGGLVPWRGPEAWAEAEAEGQRPRTRQEWLTFGLHVRRGAASTLGRNAQGKPVQLYALDATETGEPLGHW